MNTYYIELDFVRAEIKETGIAISQGDYGRVKFSIAVKKDGEIITDAASADISFQLTNGYIVQGVLSGAEGLYDYIFQGNELQAPGKTIATVTLNYADGRTSSEAFSFDVRYNPLYGRFIDAGPYITDLENIKSQAQTYVEYLEKLIEQIKLEMGQTALTKESLANNFDITEEGVKALDAAAGRTLNLNKIDKTAIVQTESTDPTTVPSSPYFKQITDKLTSDLTESKNGVLLYSGKIKYNDEISVPNLHKYKLFHLGDNQNELYGCDVGGVVGNVLEFNLSGQVSGRAVFSSIKFHIIKANTLKVIFNIQVNVTADNAIEYVSLERESQITLWGVPLI